jgi:hypothetical protein
VFFSSQKPSEDRTKLVGVFDGKGKLKDIERTLQAYGKRMNLFTDKDFYVPESDKDPRPENLKSTYTMSTFRGHGLGATKFKTNLYHDFLQRENNPETRRYKTIRISWSESYLTNYEVMSALVHDSWFAMGSFIFVGAFVLIHLHSIWLSFFAIYGIIISFPAAYYFFFVVMEFRKMMILNFVALFLIMGIGADDVFVMFDAYNQARAALGERSSPGQRLRWAYLEAGSAMLVTTVTTAGSFYSNCMSEVVVVRQFGFFMGTVVLLNWIHVMVIFPSVLLVYEIWWGRMWRRCCCCLHKYKCCVKCCASDLTVSDEVWQSTRNLLKTETVAAPGGEQEISAEDAASGIESRHAQEIAERDAALETAQKAKRDRLQERLAARKNHTTLAALSAAASPKKGERARRDDADEENQRQFVGARSPSRSRRKTQGDV